MCTKDYIQAIEIFVIENMIIDKLILDLKKNWNNKITGMAMCMLLMVGRLQCWMWD